MVDRARADISYGIDVTSGRRVAFPRTAHGGKMMQIRGETGGGKSLLLATLLLQYLQPYSIDDQIAFDPIVVIDLGGDSFTFNLLKQECERLERPFKWLSLDPLDDSYGFDPLQSCRSLQGSSGRKANFVTAGLNLAYTEGFGTGYFGRLNLSTIREALVRLDVKGVTSPTLVVLADELTQMARRNRQSRDAAEALYALDQLLDYTALAETADQAHSIDIDLALEKSHVLYFFLPTLQETLAARAVGTLAAWSVINAAAYRTKTGQPQRTIPVFMDEAAQIVHGQSFQDALVLSRKYGIRKHIVYQSEAQLRSARGTDMSQVVKDNCAIKAFFTTDTSSKGGELYDLQGYSKDETVPRLGTSQAGLRTTTSQSEHEEPILKRNTVVDVNNTFGEYFLVFKDGQGHQEPLRLMSEFPTSREKHQQLSNCPLPQKTIRRQSLADIRVHSATTSQTSDSLRPQRLRQLHQLLKQIKLEEQWKLRC